MVLRILKISSLIAILLTLSACGNLRMDLFGKKLLPGQEGGGDSGSSTSYPKITKVEADTVGASQLHTSSLPRFTTALSLNGRTIVPSLEITGTPEEVASLLTLPPPGSEGVEVLGGQHERGTGHRGYGEPLP